MGGSPQASGSGQLGRCRSLALAVCSLSSVAAAFSAVDLLPFVGAVGEKALLGDLFTWVTVVAILGVVSAHTFGARSKAKRSGSAPVTKQSLSEDRERYSDLGRYNDPVRFS